MKKQFPTSLEFLSSINSSQEISSLEEIITDRKKRYKWTDQETFLYFTFLLQNFEILDKKLKKQKQRVFNKMAGFIKTRSSRQCKSHHQKLMQKYLTIQKIIQKLQQETDRYKQNTFYLRKQISIFQKRKQSQESVLNSGLNQKMDADSQKVQVTEGEKKSFEMSNIDEECSDQNINPSTQSVSHSNFDDIIGMYISQEYDNMSQSEGPI